ncbi:hypothetical protein H2203_002385 [Taxawa tesnikishii (nom. ined.)]|nr:hypothetical protein H2203_002385 [Dothideales sp. JES 119]
MRGFSIVPVFLFLAVAQAFSLPDVHYEALQERQAPSGSAAAASSASVASVASTASGTAVPSGYPPSAGGGSSGSGDTGSTSQTNAGVRNDLSLAVAGAACAAVLGAVAAL